MPLPALAAGLITAAVPSVLNTIGGLIGAGQQSNKNMELAKYQSAQNMKMAQYQYAQDMKMMQYQNQYNSPAAQMARYEAAGLNKNLVYGQGSPGNMQQAPKYPDLKYPDIRQADYQSAFAGIGTQLLQNQLLAAQVDLTKNKADESGVKQDLIKAQTNLTNANPYLNKGYVSAMVTNLESIAKLKEQEATVMTNYIAPKDGERGGEFGMIKMVKELELLEQKYRLGQSDKAIKAKILESKEFQNELQEIQVKWMKDKEITPQHIYQGIMLLLSKMM